MLKITTATPHRSARSRQSRADVLCKASSGSTSNQARYEGRQKMAAFVLVQGARIPQAIGDREQFRLLDEASFVAPRAGTQGKIAYQPACHPYSPCRQQNHWGLRWAKD